ncbi:hypothetical protein BGY98DRAFT_388733 [Russula aff. rugulosa BPL654]|nr:hypothetical protein BGY98DRAFT_388733 [Russula aff. rugulosa BPL654]
MECGTACFALFSSLVSVYFKEEREGGAVFSSLSILYRISLFSFPFAVVCVFYFFFFRKNSVGLSSVVLMRCGVTTYALLFSFLFFLYSFLRFPSPFLSIHSLLPARRPPPARNPVSISYRIVLYFRLTD